MSLKSSLTYRSHCREEDTHVPSSVLKTYYIQQQNLGSDCSVPISSDSQILSISASKANGNCDLKCRDEETKLGRNCYQFTPKNELSFTEARKWCITNGGDLALYNDNLKGDLDFLNAPSSYWILGVSSALNPVLPYIRPEESNPMFVPVAMTVQGFEPNRRQPGLCSFPALTPDVVDSKNMSVTLCNSCQNGGRCYPLHGTYTMCDCKSDYGGLLCDRKSGNY